MTNNSREEHLELELASSIAEQTLAYKLTRHIELCRFQGTKPCLGRGSEVNLGMRHFL
jgi:hypothetical protein